LCREKAEKLEREKYMYYSEAGPYCTKQKFKTLVQRIENIFSEENSGWLQIIKESSKRKDEAIE